MTVAAKRRYDRGPVVREPRLRCQLFGHRWTNAPVGLSGKPVDGWVGRGAGHPYCSRCGVRIAPGLRGHSVDRYGAPWAPSGAPIDYSNWQRRSADGNRSKDAA